MQSLAGSGSAGFGWLRSGITARMFAILHGADGPLDLALSDLMMPDLAGPDVVTRVQMRPPRPRTFMGAHATHLLVHGATRQDRRAFIRKSFAPSALARKVREVWDA